MHIGSSSIAVPTGSVGRPTGFGQSVGVVSLWPEQNQKPRSRQSETPNRKEKRWLSLPVWKLTASVQKEKSYICGAFKQTKRKTKPVYVRVEFKVLAERKRKDCVMQLKFPRDQNQTHKWIQKKISNVKSVATTKFSTYETRETKQSEARTTNKMQDLVQQSARRKQRLRRKHSYPLSYLSSLVCTGNCLDHWKFCTYCLIIPKKSHLPYLHMALDTCVQYELHLRQFYKTTRLYMHQVIVCSIYCLNTSVCYTFLS